MKKKDSPVAGGGAKATTGFRLSLLRQAGRAGEDRGRQGRAGKGREGQGRQGRQFDRDIQGRLAQDARNSQGASPWDR
jgi:hypothetical protein